MRQFKITTSCHGQMAIELTDASRKEHDYLRRAVCDQRIDSEFYKRKQSVMPFLQGGSDNTEGWILIEFWTLDRDAVQSYVDWLNSDVARKLHKYIAE